MAKMKGINFMTKKKAITASILTLILSIILTGILIIAYLPARNAENYYTMKLTANITGKDYISEGNTSVIHFEYLYNNDNYAVEKHWKRLPVSLLFADAGDSFTIRINPENPSERIISSLSSITYIITIAFIMTATGNPLKNLESINFLS